MKINEILTEQQHGGIGSLIPGVKRAMPNAVEFPKLKSQDPYKQLRMGMALASALSPNPMDIESAFGEDMTLIGYTDADMEIIKLAMKILGKEYTGDIKQLSTDKSEEALDVNIDSPIAKPKKNKFGV
jgi:hypothetical protein